MAWLQRSPKYLRLLLSVMRPSVPVSLFFCLGQCYTLLRSRFSPAFVTFLAVLLLSLMILSLPILSHYGSVLSILNNLALSYLHLALCLSHLRSSHPHALSLLLLLLPTHSFSIHILEDIYEHETERVHLHHFRCRGNLHFLLEPSSVPPPLPYLANPDSGFGFVLLIFF